MVARKIPKKIFLKKIRPNGVHILNPEVQKPLTSNFEPNRSNFFLFEKSDFFPGGTGEGDGRGAPGSLPGAAGEQPGAPGELPGSSGNGIGAGLRAGDVGNAQKNFQGIFLLRPWRSENS